MPLQRVPGGCTGPRVLNLKALLACSIHRLAGPHLRCWALMLFYNVLLGLLLPLLLMVPLRQRSQLADGGSSTALRKGLLGQLDRCIEACLRALLLPTAHEHGTISVLGGWLARWLLLLTLLWMACCLLAEPR